VTEEQIEYWNLYVNGNNHALGELYVTIFEKLVFRAIYYTKNPETARDIVSELFVSLIELNYEARIKHWSEIKNIEALLLAIVRNKCLDNLKISAGRLKILKVLDSTEERTQEEKSELIKHLEECISELSEDERKLMNLHITGYSNNEIGIELEITEKTVRNKLSISRKRIIKLWHQMSLLIHLL
jgi:RNA polymerase sigma factor (sigma-70 family)